MKSKENGIVFNFILILILYFILSNDVFFSVVLMLLEKLETVNHENYKELT